MNPKYLELFNELQPDAKSTHTHLNSRVLIVDGLNQFIRAWATSPITSEDGIHVGGITGFFLTVGFACKQINPTRVILVFDGKGGSQRRRSVYSEYKNNRKPGSDIKRSPYLQTDEDPQKSMYRQMTRLGEYLNILPVTTIVIDHIEADDTIAYLTTLVRAKGGQSFIMSTDRDFLQLISNDVTVWSPTKKKMYFEQEVVDEYKIHSKNFLLYRTITGDKGDNLPKVPGIGISTLLKAFPSFGEETQLDLDFIFDECKRQPKNKCLSKLLQYEDMIRTNYKLMQLHDVDISGTSKLKILELFDYTVPPFVKRDFFNMLVDDRMSTAIRNIDMWTNQVFLPLDNYSRTHRHRDGGIDQQQHLRKDSD